MPLFNLCCGIALVAFAAMLTTTITERYSTIVRWLALLLIGFVALSSLVGVWLERPLPTISGGAITWALAAYLAASTITFVVYGYDKRAAGLAAWRISERSLHVMGLLGGWPGALLAQLYFDHKRNWRRKWRFQLWNWLIVAVHISFWIVQNRL
jgi:uncharacterized membrane protein YsdA (DUF1294 family)